MSQTMKRIICLLLTVWSVLLLNAQPRSAGTPVDGIVAVIGKEVILQSDLEKNYLDYKMKKEMTL